MLTLKLGELMRKQGLASLKLDRTPSLFCTERQLTQSPTLKSTLQSQDYPVITEKQDVLGFPWPKPWLPSFSSNSSN